MKIKTSDRQHQTLSYLFVLGWAIASAAGGALAGFLEGAGMAYVALSVLSGLFVGIAQWFVGRTSALRLPIAWIPITWFWWVGGYILIPSLFWKSIFQGLIQWLNENAGMSESIWQNGVHGFVALMSLGAIQWLILRERLSLAWLWIPVSAVAGALRGMISTPVISCIPGYDCTHPLDIVATLPYAIEHGVHNFVIEFTGWLVYGLLTGLLVWWLSQRQRTT